MSITINKPKSLNINYINSQANYGEVSFAQKSIEIIEENNELLNLLKKTHPGLEILSSFNIGDNFSQSIFLGIKDLNDNYSQEFTDGVIEIAKKILTETFSGNHKIIWDDYKNFVLKIDTNANFAKNHISELNNTINTSLFQAYKNQCRINQLEIKFTKKNFPLKVLTSIGKIEDKEQELYKNIILSLAYSRSNLEKEATGYNYGYLDFMDKGYAASFIDNLDEEILIIVDNNGKKESKKVEKKEFLELKRKNQIKEWYIINLRVKKYFRKTNNEYKTTYLFNEDGGEYMEISPELYDIFMNGYIPKESSLYKNIEETYYTYNIKDILNEEYTSGDCKYIVEDEFITIINLKNRSEEKIQIFNSKYNFFSELLLQKVRKKEIPEELSIYKKIRKLINLINIDGEFIFPEWKDINSKEYEKEINKYQRIKEKIINYQIDDEVNEYLKRYYKGGYNSEYFKKYIKDKQGTIVFFDIKNLGIYNIYSHLLELRKVEDKEQTLDDAKLNSGTLVTKIVKDITKIDSIANYPHTKGGDEGLIFYEGESDPEKHIQDIQEINKEIGTFCRITTASNSEGILTILDEKTKISKLVEKYFDKIKQRILAILKHIYNTHKDLLINDLGAYEEEDIEKMIKILKKKYLINKKILNTINKLMQSYIKFDEQYQDWFIVIGKNKFKIKDTIDENNSFIENSKFLNFLDANGLGRSGKDRRESNRTNNNDRRKNS